MSTRTDTLFPYTAHFLSWIILLQLSLRLSWTLPPRTVPIGLSATASASRSLSHVAETWLAAVSWTTRTFAAISIKRSEEHTSDLQSLMRLSYAVFCSKKHNNTQTQDNTPPNFTKQI